VTNDLTERIHKAIEGSIADLACAPWVHIREGWGDIFYLAIRIRGPQFVDRDELDGNIRSAVTGVIGAARHVIKIEWN
jgi:hypothetical protein